MKWFQRFYLDKEKDMIVDLYREEGRGTMHFVLSTPNHGTGNLIRNLAALCNLPLSEGKNGLLVIRGTVPSYIDGYNRLIYVFRLGDTKVANIYPDGRVETKAHIPAISKTLMSQTKDYRLDEKRTIVKTYIRSENKFRTDLHTHMNANLHPDILIALGICHQIRYPLYYIKKLGLRCSAEQEEKIATRRAVSEEKYRDCGLTGKYLTRRIDDNTFLNFADLILNDPDDAAYNIPRIRRSLAILKDGQAVFTNLEKVYLYRYVFCKGQAAEDRIELETEKTIRIPDADIRAAVRQILTDRMNPAYRENTLVDRIICKVGTITSCIPEFWLSLVLILLFAVTWHLLPSSGAYDLGMADSFTSRAVHLILPLTVVVLSHLWYYAYMLRNKLLDEIRQEYVLLARAKGLSCA